MRGATAKLATLGLALLLLMALPAATASAHSQLMSTDPVENAQLTEGPERVSATFNERLQSAYAQMTVVGPDERLWSTGEPAVDGPVVSIALRPLGPVGRYTVNYRVTSADGHPVSGSWAFELTVAGTGEPGPPVGSHAAGEPEEMPVWPFVVGAVVIVAAGLAWSMRRRQT